MRSVALAFALCLLAACGSTVHPIDLHDPSVPLEARRFVADAQDGASVARARRDDAERKLAEMERWHEEVFASQDWPADAGAAQAFRSLAEARLELARLQYTRAEAEVELASAKLEFITAQTAIRHDLAIYELEPLQTRLDIAREKLKNAAGAVEGEQRNLDQMVTQWWAAFGNVARGGDSDKLYTGFQIGLE